MSDYHTEENQRRNALFLSWSDFILDSRIAFFEEVLHHKFPNALLHNHVRFHDTEYIEEEFLSLYRINTNTPSRYLQQCYQLHPDTAHAVNTIIETPLAKLHHKKRTPNTISESLYEPFHNQDERMYYDMHAFDIDQRVLQRRYVMNHYTIDYISMLQHTGWHNAFLKQLDKWCTTIHTQLDLLGQMRHPQSSFVSSSASYTKTLQQFQQELLRHKEVLLAFQEKGVMMQLLCVIRKILRAQNCVIQFFLQCELHTDCLNPPREHTRKSTRESYLEMNKMYKMKYKNSKSNNVQNALRDLLCIQRQLLHMKDTNQCALTPFRLHLLHNTPLTTYIHTAPNALCFLDNLFTEAEKKTDVMQYVCSSFAGSLVSCITNAFHSQQYKRLRTFHIESENINTYCYFDVQYNTSTDTNTDTSLQLISTPKITQPAGKHQQTERSRARTISFANMGLLDDFYGLYVPSVGDKPNLETHLHKRESFVLHPASIYRVYKFK